MRAVVFSDLHLHNFKQFNKVDENGLGSRLKEGLFCLDQIYDYCVGNLIETVIFCGDLLHDGSLITPDILNELLSRLNFFHRKMRCYFLLGQHDIKDQFHNIIRPFDDIIIPMDTPCVVNPAKNVWIHAFPAAKTKEEQIEYFSTCSSSSNIGKKILLGHFLLKEIIEADAMMPFAPPNALEYSDLPKGFDLILLGDYHNHVWLPKLKVMSVGATHHRTFASKNRPLGGFIDLDLKTLKFKRIELNAPRFVEIKEPFAPGQFTQNGNYYKIHAKNKQEMDQIKEGFSDHKGRMEIVLKSDEKEAKIENRLSVTVDMEPENILSKYVDYFGKSKEYLRKGLEYVGQDS